MLPTGSPQTDWLSESGTAQIVTRSDYDQRGSYWEVSYSKAQPYIITVCTQAPHGRFYSRGVSRIETLGQESRVSYRVDSGHMLGFRTGLPRK